LSEFRFEHEKSLELALVNAHFSKSIKRVFVSFFYFIFGKRKEEEMNDAEPLRDDALLVDDNDLFLGLKFWFNFFKIPFSD